MSVPCVRGAAVADDRFCEECGAPALGPTSSVAAVTEQGRTHHRNEDAFELRETADGVVAVVCDGISTSQLRAPRGGGGRARGRGRARSGAERRPRPRRRHRARARPRHARPSSACRGRSRLACRACTLVCATCRGGEIVDRLDRRQPRVLAGGRRRPRAHRRRLVGDRAGRRRHAERRRGGRRPPRPRADPLGRRGRARRRAAHAALPRRWRPDGCCSAPTGSGTTRPSRSELAALVAALAPAATPAAVARRLTDVAMERGGRDDITVAVIDVDPSGRTAP